MRNSNAIIVGILLIELGLIFQMIDSVIAWNHWNTNPVGGNLETLLQLSGTLSIIVGLVSSVIGSFKLVRKQPPSTKSVSEREIRLS